MHYTACAFGNRGWTNMQTHWRFQPFSSILLMAVEIVVPWPKVPRRNLVHHVCCSHVITTRGAPACNSPQIHDLRSMLFPLLPANCMGKQIMLTSITSIMSPWTCAFLTMHHGKCTICSFTEASCAHLHVHHTLCTTIWALKCASLHCCTGNIINVSARLTN
jgi:hypothetical protein